MLTVLRLALSLAAAAGFATNSAVLPRSRVGLRHGLTVRMDEEKAAPPPAPVEAEAEEEAPPPPPPPPAVQYSESMPFLVKRKALNGYVGDVGFDPVGFSEILPMVRRRRRRRAPARACAARPRPGPSALAALAALRSRPVALRDATPPRRLGWRALTPGRRARRTGCARLS